jgi:hypothetical protein
VAGCTARRYANPGASETRLNADLNYLWPQIVGNEAAAKAQCCFVTEGSRFEGNSSAPEQVNDVLGVLRPVSSPSANARQCWGNRLSMERLGMKRNMIANEGSDEVVAMIKSRMESKRQGVTDGFAGILEQMRLELSLEKFVRSALINQ